MLRSVRTQILVAAAISLLAPLALATAAGAARGLTTGIGDNYYVFAVSEQERASVFDRTVEANAGIVRLQARWRQIAADAPPASPADPTDPSYDFSELDAAVIAANQRGLDVLMMIFDAPEWAEGPDRPVVFVRPGTWKPDPTKLGDFARALAQRYSGGFAGLPRVRRFQIWNEPNLDHYLSPQYEGKKLVSPQHYTRMLNAAYAGIKSVSPNNFVVTGGTAPYGDPPGGHRSRPLQFWRKVLCLKGRRKLEGKRCKPEPNFDALAHHPINLGAGGPTGSAIHPDDASIADLGNVGKVLHAAERERTLGTGGNHPLWATEFWWQSDPPADELGVPLRKHARWYQESLYQIWRQGASVAMILQVADSTLPLNTGLYFADGAPKPALQAFRFPFVLDRRKRGRVIAWGRAPASGKLTIERGSGGGWSKVSALKAKDGGVFKLKLKLDGRPRLRARIGQETSLVSRP
ncbi:MAG: hypothetical protein K0R88_755 [Solirubrobacterales bacterium]|jgi:hypothetical protein|nr:hypothetical protein [Solirubrobacterales bacterium]